MAYSKKYLVKNKLLEIRLREYMLQDQKDFANFLEIDPSQYSRYERGEVFPGLPIALHISKKLGRKIEDIWYLV